MAIFVTTGRFSHSGASGLMSKPEDRTEIVSNLVAAAGGKLLNYYVTTGDTDFLLVTEASSADAALAAGMAASATGAVSDMKTVQAWTSADFAKIAAKAGKIAGKYRPPG